MSDELKPCPFCGKPVELISCFIDNKYRYFVSHNCRLAEHTNCKLTNQIFETSAEAFLDWNARPLEDALRAQLDEKDAEIARLKEALLDIRDLARTGLPPSWMTEEGWNIEKVGSIAHKADFALNKADKP